MKEWAKPEILELDICNTELDLDKGWVQDGGVYDDSNPPEFQRPLYSRY